MTHTTTPAEIHHRARRISSSRGNFGRRLLRWIFLYWIMLSLVAEEPTRWVAGIIVLEKPASFD
jgi:hypothetical protein